MRRRASMRCGAHPHSRGENEAGDEKGSTFEGSSPLTRGKLEPRHDRRGMGRLIPTHAGKTPRPPGPPSQARAHPHSRGENIRLILANWAEAGSSPLTRGKRGAPRSEHGLQGLIPTHAGKTTGEEHREDTIGAHPHSRGENASCAGLMPNAAGSSPLTRGKRRWGESNPPQGGLIPTHAGKTGRGSCAVRPRRAHPHSRGENRPKDRAQRIKLGSSPLTRGKRGCRFESCRRRGLIPTHAGKTTDSGSWLAAAAAHPHSRGENTS